LTVVKTKNNKDVASTGDESWMKLKHKNGDIIFIELEQNPQHFHLHVGENKLEPKGAWK